MGSFNIFTSFLNITLVYLILVTLYKTSNGYETYYVEDICKDGNLLVSLSHNGSSSARILRGTRHTSYSLHMTCRIKIEASPGWGILISIREIGFRTNFDGTCKDYLKILVNDEDGLGGDILCHTSRNFDETRTYSSQISSNHSNSEMELLYYTSADLDNKTRSGYIGFTLTSTAFKYAKSGSCEGNQQFLCGNSRCVWSGLLCDGHNNCGDLSDEKAFQPSNCGYIGNGTLVLAITGVLIVVIGFVSAIITLVCYQDRQRRRRTLMRLRRRTESLIPIIESLQDRPEDNSSRDRGMSYQTFRSKEMSTVRDSSHIQHDLASNEQVPSRSATIS